MSPVERDIPSCDPGPSTGRLFLTSAIAYLVLGLVLQAVHLVDLWLGLNPVAYTVGSVVTQALLIGWLSQATIGLIYNTLIASPRLGQAAWGCLNLGLILAVLGQPLLALTGSGLAGGSVVGGGLLQLTGAMFFVADLVTAWRGRLGTKDEKRQMPSAK